MGIFISYSGQILDVNDADNDLSVYMENENAWRMERHAAEAGKKRAEFGSRLENSCNRREKQKSMSLMYMRRQCRVRHGLFVCFERAGWG